MSLYICQTYRIYNVKSPTLISSEQSPANVIVSTSTGPFLSGGLGPPESLVLPSGLFCLCPESLVYGLFQDKEIWQCKGQETPPSTGGRGVIE